MNKCIKAREKTSRRKQSCRAGLSGRSVHQNFLVGLQKPGFLASPGFSSSTCISNQLSGDTSAAGLDHAWRTTAVAGYDLTIVSWLPPYTGALLPPLR